MGNLSKTDGKDNNTRINALIEKARILREGAAAKAAKALAAELTKKQRKAASEERKRLIEERKAEDRIRKKLKAQRVGYSPLQLPDEPFIKKLKTILEAGGKAF